MMISRAELFNKLATLKAPPEANEYKAQVYSIIQSMETEEPVEPTMKTKQAIWTLIDCRRLLIDGLVSVQASVITEAFDMAIEALSADAVEVIRCDDITHMFCVYFHHKVYEDDYCSNAVERREDGEA